MVPIGLSLKLRDRRVDRMLKAEGFATTSIYYSPITSWLFVLLMIASSAYFLIWFFASSVYGLLLIPYLLTSYLINARLSHSFSIEESRLIVINPNWPFRKLQTFQKDEITSIVIDSQESRWRDVFLCFGGNYLEIQTGTYSRRYYCIFLDVDAWDENWTEKTMDDFHYHLEQAGFPVDFRLDD